MVSPSLVNSGLKIFRLGGRRSESGEWVKLGLSDQDAEKGGELGGEGSQTGENFKICQCFEIIIAIFSTNYEMIELQKIQYVRIFPLLFIGTRRYIMVKNHCC